MSRRKPKPSPPGSAVAAWGWYGILFVPAADAPGGSFEGTVLRPKPSRAFWCAWWSEDPRRTPDADPDDFLGLDDDGCRGLAAVIKAGLCGRL